MAAKQRPHVDPRFASAPTLFFVIGAQKSGTSWLYAYMRQHARICVPYWKELNYWARIEGIFSDDVMLRTARRMRAKDSIPFRIKRRFGFVDKRTQADDLGYRHAVATARKPRAPHKAYADAIFAAYTPECGAFGEVCPQYALLSAETFREMSRLGPNVRFVFVMRDPVARFISSVRHDIRHSSGEEGITQENLSAGALEALKDHQGWSQRMTRYQDTIAQLETYVSKDQISYCFYEDLFDQDQIDRLCAFLGVASWPADVDRKIHLGARPEVTLPQAQQTTIAQHFRDVYAVMAQKFGNDLPAAWRASRALIGNAEGVNA